jgi:hypothetical protein
MQRRRRVEGLAQWLGRGAQARGGECGEGAGLVSPSASSLQHARALTPSRSETTLDTLMCASSRRASSRFCGGNRLQADVRRSPHAVRRARVDDVLVEDFSAPRSAHFS